MDTQQVNTGNHVPKRIGRIKGMYTRLHTVQQHGTDMLQVNTLLMHRWELFAKLGVGAHSEIYAAYDRELHREVAIKVDREEARLRNEIPILKALAKSDHFCEFIHYQPTYVVNFIAMDLQGPSLKEISDYYKPLSWKTVLHIGLQMLEALQALHVMGYVHGDIKPSSFLIGLPPKHMAKIYLIDFGLSRRLKQNNVTSFRDINQNTSMQTSFDDKPKIVKAKFQGTFKYASPGNHKGYRLGRRDDLWSLLYTLLDFLCELPWSNINKRDEILDMKISLTDKLTKVYLGEEGIHFKDQIKKMNLSDLPNYKELKSCFVRALKHYPNSDSQNFEWIVDPHLLWEINYVRVYEDKKEADEESEPSDLTDQDADKEDISRPQSEELEARVKDDFSTVEEGKAGGKKSLLKSDIRPSEVKFSREEGEIRASDERTRRTLVFNPVIETSSETAMQKDRLSKAISSDAPSRMVKPEFPREPLIVSRLINVPRKVRKDVTSVSAASLKYFVQRPKFSSKISLFEDK